MSSPGSTDGMSPPATPTRTGFSTPRLPESSNKILELTGPPAVKLAEDIIAFLGKQSIHQVLSDVDRSYIFPDDQQDEVVWGAPTLFPITPEQNAVGRTGLGRPTQFMKLAEMHINGARCGLTLTIHGLQVCHVISVELGFSKNDIRCIEWATGQRFGTFNIHSARNLWLLSPDMHFYIDRGYFKLFPELQVMRAIHAFLLAVSQAHSGKEDNEGLQEHGLTRVQAFPPGNYTYTPIPILAHKEFFIPRLGLLDPVKPGPSEARTVRGVQFDFVPMPHPLPYPERIDEGEISHPLGDQLKPEVGNLKGTRTSTKLENLLDCVPAIPSVQLPQCPLLVALNAGNFLLELEEKFNALDSDEEFHLKYFVGEGLHLSMAMLARNIARLVKQQSVPKPNRTTGSTKGKGRSMASRSDLALNLDMPREGPSTRSRASSRAGFSRTDNLEGGSSSSYPWAADSGGRTLRSQSSLKRPPSLATLSSSRSKKSKGSGDKAGGSST
ncbi:hypothetical protein PM082_000379 [Marasmius tenuissimus]|nr:hypothetical protein PM082_000379 [Marasmius tenuissimus]